MKTYIRLALGVEVLFTKEGEIRPLRIHVGHGVFEIERVISQKNYCPGTVPCIAPVEYTVQVTGLLKKIYYEKDTDTWFAVKESEA